MAGDDPELFREVLVKESSSYLRREVFQAWTFQRSIDTFATGGLNCEALNTLRAGVEGLRKNEQGVILSGSSVALCARELEACAITMFDLGIIDARTSHGPSLSFNCVTVTRLLVKGHGLEEFAKAGSNDKPVLLSFALDGAQLTN